MTRKEQLTFLIDALLAEMPEYREQAEAFPADDASRRRLLRSLMNVRPPMPLDRAFLEVQDALLDIKRKFGKNAILRGMSFEEGATARDRNNQIGGHKA